MRWPSGSRNMAIRLPSAIDFRDRRIALSALIGGFAVLLATLVLRGLAALVSRRRRARNERYVAY